MVTSTQSSTASSVYSALNGGSGTTTAAASTATAAQDRFMTLLVTQLKNQDPLSPMDNSQMTSQMAQISTVSGIDKVNATLQALSASMTSNQTVQATTMIGHGVLVAGGGTDLAKSSTGANVAYGGFSLPQAVDSAKVSIYDASGALVNTLDLGAQSAGISKWQWDGTNSSGAAMPAGSYTFKVNATSAGSTVAATTLQYGVVNSVTQGTTGVTMSVGSMKTEVALSAVQQVI